MEVINSWMRKCCCRYEGRFLQINSVQGAFPWQEISNRYFPWLPLDYTSSHAEMNSWFVREFRRQFSSWVFSCGGLTSGQRKLKKWPTCKWEPRREDTRGQVKHGASLTQSLLVSSCDCNRSTNKCNHRIQNPLLLVTEPRTHDNIYIGLCQYWLKFSNIFYNSVLILLFPLYNCGPDREHVNLPWYFHCTVANMNGKYVSLRQCTRVSVGILHVIKTLISIFNYMSKI
jgi:hypothetical protein